MTGSVMFVLLLALVPVTVTSEWTKECYSCEYNSGGWENNWACKDQVWEVPTVNCTTQCYTTVGINRDKEVFMVKRGCYDMDQYLQEGCAVFSDYYRCHRRCDWPLCNTQDPMSTVTAGHAPLRLSPLAALLLPMGPLLLLLRHLLP
ncbi:uncharacterized protein LOC143290374 [Babylonia areolata]|uniref:uncharacterized protein LOC143290374 n=1 Tax=Babylonia areolata TaxID=304850 RepID=UPI003FD019D7